MGAIKNSGIFKGVSAKGQIAKGLAKNGVIFWKKETLHPHTVKILARANAIGATPPTNIPNFDTYVRSMYQIWMDYCDVFFRFRGTGDANFKKINLANPDGALAIVYGGYTLDNSGFRGNGINAYIDTNFNPALLISGQKYQVNDASRAIVVASTGSPSGLDGLLSSYENLILNANGTNHRINQGLGNLSSSIDLSGTGLKILNRTNDANNTNGINKGNQTLTNAVSAGAISSATQLILRQNTSFGGGLVSSYFMGKSIPFATSQLIRSAENADMANLGLTQIA